MIRYFVYGTMECPYCEKARELLESENAECIFFELSENDLQETKQFYQSKTIPIILENNKDSGLTKMIGGCSDLEKYLEY